MRVHDLARDYRLALAAQEIPKEDIGIGAIITLLAAQLEGH